MRATLPNKLFRTTRTVHLDPTDLPRIPDGKRRFRVHHVNNRMSIFMDSRSPSESRPMTLQHLATTVLHVVIQCRFTSVSREVSHTTRLVPRTSAADGTRQVGDPRKRRKELRGRFKVSKLSSDLRRKHAAHRVSSTPSRMRRCEEHCVKVNGKDQGSARETGTRNRRFSGHTPCLDWTRTGTWSTGWGFPPSSEADTLQGFLQEDGGQPDKQEELPNKTVDSRPGPYCASWIRNGGGPVRLTLSAGCEK